MRDLVRARDAACEWMASEHPPRARRQTSRSLWRRASSRNRRNVFRATAERLGLSTEELARAAVNDLLSTPDAEFQAVARRVVTKNQDLYKRLA